MWGNTNKHSPCVPGAGAAGVEIDLSACTAAPTGLPSAQANSFGICSSNPEEALSSRRFNDELQATFHVAGASGEQMVVRPWVYMPEYKRDLTAGLGTWKALRLLEAIPIDIETTDTVGTVFRIPVPAGSTHMYLQRFSVVGAPTATEAAVLGTEELT